MKAVLGECELVAQDRAYHWLGSGIYFWENDPERALEWATEKAGRGELDSPFVIGAVIDLGNCFDLQVRENARLLTQGYDSLLALTKKGGGRMPENRTAPKDGREDKVLRFLDCAVINHIHGFADPAFDTVKGLFIEGDPVFPGAKIYDRTHSEIAVCNPACIKALFLPRGGST